MSSDIPERECFVNGNHPAHNWWYVKDHGDEHQMWHGFDPIVDVGAAALYADLRQFHCPGKDEYDTP